jgi:hypothetical protein
VTAVRRPVAAGLLLLAVYVALSFACDPKGYLGTDTGGKVATLRVMRETGRLDPDLGYWAERWDPNGRFHPLYYTSHTGTRWVNVTTLPALYAALPLFDLGGYRLALLVPMLGAVAAAFAGRALARRLGAGDGWLAFWIVGLASPIAVYALDFWEHTLGVALMGWAVVALYDAIEVRERRGAIVAGLLFGAAATMRTEVLVYAAAAFAGWTVLVFVRRRRLMPAVAAGLLFVIAMALPLIANDALERATVHGSVRSTRAVATAEAPRSDGAVRTQEAVLTFTGLTASLERTSYLVGLCLLALLLLVARAAATPAGRRVATVALAGAALLYATRFAKGLGFVPGLVAAAPLAGLGLAYGWRGRPRPVTVFAAGVLPAVWALQYTGGAPPQWGGRYLLLSGLVLGVVGVAALGRLDALARAGFVALAVAVTGFGLAWTSVRTHDVARAGSALTRRPEAALVFREAHLAREAGGFYERDRRWLTAVSARDARDAFAVLDAAGIESAGVVSIDEGQPDDAIAGWHRVGSSRLRLFSGVDLRVTSYAAG